MERVEGLEVRDAQHGVKIAQTLFAARFADRVMADAGIKMINIHETVKLIVNKQRQEITAKIDTGAWRTSIDRDLATKLGLLENGNIIRTKKVKSSLGYDERPLINLSYYLAGRKIHTIAGVAGRRSLKNQIIIGRRDLQGFLVKP